MPTGLTLWVEFKCLPVARVFEGEPWGFSAQPGSLSVLCPNRACKVTAASQACGHAFPLWSP